MKKSKFFRRVVAFVLVFVMTVSLFPLSALAVNKFDIVTDREVTYTGIQNDTFNDEGTINWPIKIYDYLADGMLFEFAQADGSVMYSSNTETTDDYSGQYVLGKAMPSVGVGHDFTTDYVYTKGQKVNNFYSDSESKTYKKTKMAAVNYQNPQYMRITMQKSYNTDYKNCAITNFVSDNGGRASRDNVRYMALVYRAQGLSNVNGVNYIGFNTKYGDSGWRRLDVNDSGIKDINGKLVRNSAEWICVVIDLYQNISSNNWSSMGSIGIDSVYIRLGLNSTSDYMDISHIAYFKTAKEAQAFGNQCLEFIKEPGEYVSGTEWNGAGNDAFGMLYPSNGAAWNSGGGKPTSTTGGTYAAYYTQSLGAVPTAYESKWTYGANINKNRKDGTDANGRLNGSGDLIGESNQVYLIQPKAFIKDTDKTSYDLSELQFDGYNLLTTATKGVFTAGLLEGTLGADGTPVYRQESVEYIADLLSKTLVIPQKATNGNNNYSYVAGVKNAEQYGTTNGKANDLAQALRSCLGITFTSGSDKGSTPKMGTYAETVAKANKLKGAFLTVTGGNPSSTNANNNIKTCMDAAYYLLNNLFVSNSYNQEQDDFRYLTLSSAKLSDGNEVFVFDGGFSYGANVDDITNKKMTQDQYKAASKQAVNYNGYNKEGGDGTISLIDVDEKDYFYYSANEGTYTTLYPFLPVVDAEGVYAGQTDSYYFAEDGKRSYTEQYGTYYNRNYNYVLASNGEFVYHEEDNLFFEFEGDDDVYLFINGQLVLDLGGGHSVSSSALNVNDYVTWARKVLETPDKYSDAEIARAKALDLENGEIVSFDFYYMERHGYGANMRIVTNMHITDPALRVEKSAYQGGKEVEYGGIVDADDPIEYNFKLTNIGNTKLYNLTFDDSDIGVSLTPDRGLFVAGDDTSTELDDINGFRVTDAHGGRLDAEDLTAVVTGYQNVGSGGNYIQSGHTYTKVADGAGTHIYYDGITINFADNEALKNFLKTLQSENTDNETVDEELTQQGSGLWVDASVTFKGIYYTMTKEQEDTGVFDNTVYVSATTRADLEDNACELLRSEARHRVYVTAIPSYYQWADHELFIPKKRVLDDASAEAGDPSSILNDYIEFFNKVDGDISKFGTKFCDRMGNLVADGHYEYVKVDQAADGQWGYVADYPEAGIYEFFLLMYTYESVGNSTPDIKKLNLGDYAIVRVLVIVTDVEDSEYVLDYGLSTENLDANGELFKNDELYGALSGTTALLMGFTDTEPYYRDYLSSSDYNRINFNSLNISENNKIQTEDGYYTVNVLVPENGKEIKYDKFSGMYTLTETGTATINVDCPMAWQDLYLYYWYDDGRNNSWPGQKMTKTSHGNYNLDVPGNVPHIIISNGTNQTIDLNLNPGREAWVEIPGTLNQSNKLYATVEYKTADGVVHAKVPEGWGDVYIYCWDVFGNGLNEWPGEKIETVDDDGFFTYTIPGDITDVIINNGGNGKQTEDLVVYAGSETWITVNDKVLRTNGDKTVSYYGATSSLSTETVTMHASVPADWAGASLYYWNSNGSDTGVNWPGLTMTKGENGLYTIEGIPADVTNVIINEGKSEKAKQTHNLTITPGVETWFNVKVKSGEGDTKVNVTVQPNWSQVYIYFFDGDAPVAEAWPGRLATKQANGTYTVDVPAGATKYIVNNGNGKESEHIALILGATNDVVVRNVVNKSSTYEVVASKETKLHIEPPAGWGDVYIHYWNENSGSTFPGEKAVNNDDGTYSFTIPAGYSGFLVTNGKNDGSLRKTADIKGFYMGIENHVAVYKDDTFRVGMPYHSDIVYGANAEKEGFTFTPTDFMDSYYSIWMAVTVFESAVDDDDEGDVTDYQATALGNPINIGKEVQMYKKITVLPANVVYYEDDFAGIKYSSDNTANIFTHYGNGSGSLSQEVDQSQEYGQDSAYQGSQNDEITGGSLTEVELKDNNEFASFEFTGTGFEIVGHTHAMESGSLRVVVKDENGKVVGEKTVITEFDQNGDDEGSESVVAVPLIRFSGLEFGKYTVSLNGVPVYDWSQWDGDRNHKPPVKTACVCIDGVRIYQPLDNSNTTEQNLALGTKVDVATYTGSTYTANLTDGKYESTFISGTNDFDWFGFKNTGDAATGNINPENSNRAVAVINLGCEAELTSARVHVFAGDNSAGAGAFTSINVYTSTDGITYTYQQSINPVGGSTASYWALGTFAQPVTAKYIKFALTAPVGSLVLMNEIEVYGTEVVTPGRNDAYLDTENGTTFTEIRNMIADRQAFAIKYDDSDGLTVSGGTSIWIENRNGVLPSDRGVKWENNVVNSVNDYLLAGPNNEVYMLESTEDDKTALVFYVQEDHSLAVHNMQIAVRGVDYGAYTGAEETGVINAEIQYGAVVDGELVWKTLATAVSTAEQYYTIPYTECPYDAENDRYQVVIRVGDTDVTGMASYTSVKLNGLEALTLNSDEVSDVVYTDDINNTIIDSNGNTLETSKFVDFIKLTDQMNSAVVVYNNNNGEPAPEGVDTSALGALYHSFTADASTDFVLTEDSKIYIVTVSESTKPDAATIETAQLVQSQFMADKLPSEEPMEIVWGLEKYADKGDIIIYANDASLTNAETYKLVVSDRAKVYAKDDNGLLYGLNTLLKHFRYAQTNAVEGFTAENYPQTKERTVHLDIARKYLTKDWINNYIKEMSWMGYNSLELHFSEDGGFRADFWDSDYFVSENGNDFSWVVGSKTQYWVEEPYKTDADAGKHLTAAELVEICNTAKQYNIEIIPSFDTPAHVDWLTWNHYNNYTAKGKTNTFNYDGTTYTLPEYINHRETYTSEESRWACLNLGDDTVQKFSFALYKDIADFFTIYAGSTKFNIGGDEVQLRSTDTWNYATFYTYVNDLTALLEGEGYKVRMYNDFLSRQKYMDMFPNTQLPELDPDIEIVYWTADKAYNDNYGMKTAESWHTEGRTVYNGMNYWTYYVLRIADASSVGADNKGKDARDPSNTWWSFYRNQEDHIYNDWNPTLFSAYNATKSTIWDDQLAGGYFMVWNDYAALNTEVEMWNGVADQTGKSENFYSLIDRMWSNSIKQWNWDIHNSTYNGEEITFTKYEELRDTHGYFPGYVETTGKNYATASVLPTPTAVSDEAYRTQYTVTFKDYNGKVIDTQLVKESFDATAPAEPARSSDVWYDYTFAGWDTDFTNITKDTVVTATYSAQATVAGKVGYLEVKVSGGTNITMSVDGGEARPMGTAYTNSSMAFGKMVTVKAETTNNNKFIAWMDAKNGEILSTNVSYTFFTSGNDVLVALYKTDLSDAGLVTFRNDKTNQIIDIQYYTSTDTIKFPADISYPGYEFAGWNLTQAEIQNMLAQGKDVTVTPVWRDKLVYFDVTVNGGSVTEASGAGDGKYLGYKGMTVEANGAPDGKRFAYWTDENNNILSYEAVYKFYPYKDTTLTAVFLPEDHFVLGITGTKPLPQEEAPEEKNTFTVYFENNWLWSDVRIYYWSDNNSLVNTGWPGVSMNYAGTENGHELYSFELPLDITGFLFTGIKNDGSGAIDQSPDIKGEFVDGRMYYMAWDNSNKVEHNDSKAESDIETENKVFYLCVSEEWAADNAWFAAYVWDSSNNSDNAWYRFEPVSGNVYKVEVPAKYENLVLVSMKATASYCGWENKLAQTADLTVPTGDTQNMLVVTKDNKVLSSNMNTIFFVNSRNWADVKAYYTDAFGTHEAQAVFVENDKNGKEIYSILIPCDAQSVAFTNGTDVYSYTVTGTVADRCVFELIAEDTKKDVTVNVGMNANDSVVVFEWCTPAEAGFTFINTGLLLVEKDKYVESTFVMGTMDKDVIQFAPAKRYQTSTGVHSVTVPQLDTGDAWVVCAFVQYIDENGNLQTKYSKQVTGKKE